MFIINCLHFAPLPAFPTHLQSMARPFGQPRVVFTIDRACDPSPQALIIFAGRYQSVQNIYLSRQNVSQLFTSIYINQRDKKGTKSYVRIVYLLFEYVCSINLFFNLTFYRHQPYDLKAVVRNRLFCVRNVLYTHRYRYL